MFFKNVDEVFENHNLNEIKSIKLNLENYITSKNEELKYVVGSKYQELLYTAETIQKLKNEGENINKNIDYIIDNVETFTKNFVDFIKFTDLKINEKTNQIVCEYPINLIIKYTILSYILSKNFLKKREILKMTICNAFNSFLFINKECLNYPLKNIKFMHENQLLHIHDILFDTFSFYAYISYKDDLLLSTFILSHYTTQTLIADLIIKINKKLLNLREDMKYIADFYKFVISLIVLIQHLNEKDYTNIDKNHIKICVAEIFDELHVSCDGDLFKFFYNHLLQKDVLQEFLNKSYTMTNLADTINQIKSLLPELSYERIGQFDSSLETNIDDWVQLSQNLYNICYLIETNEQNNQPSTKTFFDTNDLEFKRFISACKALDLNDPGQLGLDMWNAYAKPFIFKTFNNYLKCKLDKSLDDIFADKTIDSEGSIDFGDNVNNKIWKCGSSCNTKSFEFSLTSSNIAGLDTIFTGQNSGSRITCRLREVLKNTLNEMKTFVNAVPKVDKNFILSYPYFNHEEISMTICTLISNIILESLLKFIDSLEERYHLEYIANFSYEKYPEKVIKHLKGCSHMITTLEGLSNEVYFSNVCNQMFVEASLVGKTKALPQPSQEEYRQSENSEKFKNYLTGKLENFYELWSDLVANTLYEQFIRPNTPNYFDYNILLTSLHFPNISTIQGNVGEPENDDIIPCPSNPSFFVVNYLYHSNKLLYNYFEYHYPKNLVKHLKSHLFKHLLDIYIRIMGRIEEILEDKTQTYPQNIIFQIIFDLTFVRHCSSNAQDEIQNKIKYERLMRLLIELVDPFDYQIIRSTLDSNVVESVNQHMSAFDAFQLKPIKQASKINMTKDILNYIYSN